MAVTPTTLKPSMNPTLFHLFLCFAIGATRLQCFVFPSLEVGWTSMFSGARKPIQGIGSVMIVKNLQQGERTSLCYNWNPTSSSANTSCFEILVPIFTNHVLGTTCQYKTFFFLLSFYTTFDVIRVKPKLVLHIAGGTILLLQSLVRRSMGTIFSNLNFGVAKNPNIDLHGPNFFDRVGWQSCNVLMGKGTINL